MNGWVRRIANASPINIIPPDGPVQSDAACFRVCRQRCRVEQSSKSRISPDITMSTDIDEKRLYLESPVIFNFSLVVSTSEPWDSSPP